MGGIKRRSQFGTTLAAALFDLKKSASICGVTRSMGLAEAETLSKFQAGDATGGGYGSVGAMRSGCVGTDDGGGAVDPATAELVGAGSETCSTRLDCAARAGSGNRLGHLNSRVASGALA